MVTLAAVALSIAFFCGSRLVGETDDPDAPQPIPRLSAEWWVWFMNQLGMIGCLALSILFMGIAFLLHGA